MDVSTLGRVCYRQFAAKRILRVLERKDVFRDLRSRRLDHDEAVLATNRACSRLDTYYRHLQGLLDDVPHTGGADPLARIAALHERDRGWLSDIYTRLAESDAGDVHRTPGLALFVQVGERSFALLPTVINENTLDPVYMAAGWRQVIFNGVIPDVSARNDLRTRIIRSNRLWQRERWSVRPIVDTAEPHGGTGGAYFNNIELHKKPIDGWVDAFWGVQSGLRLALPIPGADNAHLVLLLTTFVPNLFQQWDASPEQYRKAIPPDEEAAAVLALAKEFSSELSGLSFAAAVLSDVARNEGALLDSSMQLLSHYAYDPQKSSPWEGRVVSLVQELHQIDPQLSSRVHGLTRLPERSFRVLDRVARELPETQESTNWKEKLAQQKAKGNRSDFSLLPPHCTVRQVIDSLTSLERGTQSTITVSEAALQECGRAVAIDHLLLTAIVMNLVQGRGVSIRITLHPTDHSSTSLVLCVTAFYAAWRLQPTQEDDFLLRPLKIEPGEKTSVGFYLTAQVLWRNNGTIEYYRLGDVGGESQAIIHLGIPVG